MTTLPHSGKSAIRRLFALHIFASLLASAVVLGAVYVGTMRLLENQTAQAVDAELNGLVRDYIEGGQFALRSAIAERSTSRSSADSLYLYATADGHPIAGNLSSWPDVPMDGTWQTIRLMRTDIDKNVLVGLRAITLPGGARLMVGRDMRSQREFRDILKYASWALLGSFLVFGSLGGLFVSRSILKRVGEIQQAATETARGDLSRRVPLRGTGDEFDRLAEALNDMLSKNETLVTELQMVTDSLSHDLRTPLARLRNTLETALANPDADNSDIIAEALSEADYVHQVFTELLDIARVEANLAQSQIEPLDLSKIVSDTVELYTPLAEEKDQSLNAQITDKAMIEGHKQFLARAISNLLDNAIKFTPSGGKIDVSLTENDDKIVLTIADTGPGISATDWPKALQRMGRLDRERGSPGAGLGLSLVAKVAALHGTEVQRQESDKGLIISIPFVRYSG